MELGITRALTESELMALRRIDIFSFAYIEIHHTIFRWFTADQAPPPSDTGID